MPQVPQRGKSSPSSPTYHQHHSAAAVGTDSGFKFQVCHLPAVGMQAGPTFRRQLFSPALGHSFPVPWELTSNVAPQ